MTYFWENVHINYRNMLHYERMDIFEKIDINETRASKECGIYHYWYFLDKGFKFQPNVCNECHDVLVIL